MKIYNTFFAFFAISSIITSCSNDDNVIIPTEKEKIFVSFNVNCEEFESTRANFTGFDNKPAFLWNEDDPIAIYAASSEGGTNYSTIRVNNSIDHRAVASGQITDDNKFVGVYPAGAAIDRQIGDPTETWVTVSVPQDQHIWSGEFIDKEALIQVGAAAKNNKEINLSMHTPCSFLVFSIGNRSHPDSNLSEHYSDIQKVTVEAFSGEDETNPANKYGISGEIKVQVSQSGDIETGKDHTTTNKVTCIYDWMGQYFPKNYKFAVAIRPGKPDHLKITVTLVPRIDPSTGELTTVEDEIYIASELYDPLKPTAHPGLDFGRNLYHEFPTLE